MAAAGMKDIKRRMKSVESTSQITKAMQLVASSKLRRAKEKAAAAIPYFDTLYETLSTIVSDPDFVSPYTAKREIKTVLLIVIAGDRGLAGGFNSNVLKKAHARNDEIVGGGGEAVIMPVGKRCVEYFQKRDFKIMSKYENIGENISIYKCFDIMDKVILAYDGGKIDSVEIVYTTYKSPLVQEVKFNPLLPAEIKSGGKFPIVNYEPSSEVVFGALMSQYLSGLFYAAVIDSYTSEQAARRNAMENATDNAEEMFAQLSLSYNRARQASITQEITEIIGGSSAAQ